MSGSALGPVLRFHLRVGARIAMLILAPVLVGAVGGGMLLGDDFLDSFSRMLYGSGSSGGSAVFIVLACLGVAATAAPRICRGLDGWLRHLPVDGLTHRRAAALAIAVAQTPLLVFLLFLSLFATRITAPSLIDALALPVTALGAALWAVPAERGVLAKLLGLAGAIAAGSGGWGWLAAGAALVVAADLVAGGLRPSPPGPLSRLPAPLPGRGGGGQGGEQPVAKGPFPLGGGGLEKGEGQDGGGPRYHEPAGNLGGGSPHLDPPPSPTRPLPGGGSPSFDAALFSARLAWRALGGKLLSAYFSALLPLGAAWAFISNNELATKHVILGSLLGGGCAVVLLFAQLGETLAALRPAWPWSRSLPWSAAGRVIADAAFLAVHALPLLILAVLLHPMALVLFGLTPFLALRAAGAMRRAPERRTGASGEILLEGLPAAAATALLPWVALPLLAMSPLALRWAAERERRQKVSRWLELHHLAVGDSQSWSA